MAEMYSSVRGLNVTNNRIEGLMADFSGLQNLEKMVDSVLRKLQLQDRVSQNVRMVKGGNMSLQEFDGWFSELVRVELGKVLGIQRARAVQKAHAAGAGSASSAVLRRTYKGEYAGNINIGGNRSRITNRKRIVPEPNGGKSGIRRHRTMKNRTKELQEYFGPDRSFVLRILEGGRDVFYATPEGPTGRRSMATYGKRGSITARNWFFHQMRGDMEQAAQQLGQTLMGAVEKWIEQEFTESTE
jgi:hypothetical protein